MGLLSRILCSLLGVGGHCEFPLGTDTTLYSLFTYQTSRTLQRPRLNRKKLLEKLASYNLAVQLIACSRWRRLQLQLYRLKNNMKHSGSPRSVWISALQSSLNRESWLNLSREEEKNV